MYYYILSKNNCKFNPVKTACISELNVVKWNIVKTYGKTVSFTYL
jgi:hypothetical protein